MTRKVVEEHLLLARDRFKALVFERSGGHCVFCKAPAIDAHHILERKLFVDGGYYLGNGAAVCGDHHWACEMTLLSVAATREAAGIHTFVLPPGLDPAGNYDKWGNRIWPSGLRSWGPLETDIGARRALIAGGVLHLLMPPSYFE